MKTKVKIIISISFLLLAVLLAYFIYLSMQNKQSDFIKVELQKLAITTKGEAQESLDVLDNYDPAVLKQLCTDVGYDYNPYLGKELNFVSYQTDSFYAVGDEKHPLKVGIFSYNEKIVCVYFMDDFDNDPNPLLPGVFSINDSLIIKN